jgi:ribosomal protein S18 acetylase RimI-like enzyme
VVYMNILTKLVNFYRKYNLVPSSLDDLELYEYFKLSDQKKNLIVEVDAEQNILGFIEFWRITYQQLGYIMCHGLIDARYQNTEDGSICFLANLAIHPDFERTNVAKLLRDRFFMENYKCELFVGDSRRRVHHHTFNVYKRTEIMSKYLTKEVS